MYATHHGSRWASLWALTWPQILMLLVQFGIGLTDAWAAGRIGPDVQASIGIAAGNGAVAAVSQSLGAGRSRRSRRFTGLTAGMRIEAVIFLPAVACQMAVAVLVGQSLGKGRRKEAQQAAYDMLGLALLGMSLLTGCLWFVREELAALMTNDTSVQAEAVRYLVFNFLSAPLMVANLVLIGVFIGAGATQYSMWSYLVSVWGVRLPLSWWLGHVVTASSSGVYWAMVASQLVQLGILLWMLLCTDWKRFSLISRAKDR